MVTVDGDNLQLPLSSALRLAQNDLVYVASRSRISRFISQSVITGATCILAGFLGLLAAYTSDLITIFWTTQATVNILMTSCYVIIGIGTSFLFLAFIRNRAVTYDFLKSANFSSFRPLQQLGQMAAVALILTIILHLDIVVLGVGNLLLNDFDKRPGIGVVIGILSGLSNADFIEAISDALRIRRRDTREAQSGG